MNIISESHKDLTIETQMMPWSNVKPCQNFLSFIMKAIPIFTHQSRNGLCKIVLCQTPRGKEIDDMLLDLWILKIRSHLTSLNCASTRLFCPLTHCLISKPVMSSHKQGFFTCSKSSWHTTDDQLLQEHDIKVCHNKFKLAEYVIASNFEWKGVGSCTNLSYTQ